MRFFKETLVPVNRPLLVLERELPLPDSFCLIAATSKTGGAAATDVEAAGCEEGSGGAEVWANDLTASNAATTSSIFPKKHRSRAICSVAMKAMFLLDMGVPPTAGVPSASRS